MNIKKHGSAKYFGLSQKWRYPNSWMVIAGNPTKIAIDVWATPPRKSTMRSSPICCEKKSSFWWNLQFCWWNTSSSCTTPICCCLNPNFRTVRITHSHGFSRCHHKCFQVFSRCFQMFPFFPRLFRTSSPRVVHQTTHSFRPARPEPVTRATTWPSTTQSVSWAMFFMAVEWPLRWDICVYR